MTFDAVWACAVALSRGATLVFGEVVCGPGLLVDYRGVEPAVLEKACWFTLARAFVCLIGPEDALQCARRALR